MQRLWTIEVRADFPNEEADKFDIVEQDTVNAAAYILAKSNLLSINGQKPEVVVYSDDLWHGHRDIEVIGNPLQNVFGSAEVSNEMLEAIKEMK